LIPLPFPTSNVTLWVWSPRSIPWNGFPFTICHTHSSDSIDDHVPKDPYALEYVWVDDAIRFLQSLGPSSFMVKTDQKLVFRLIPTHPADWYFDLLTLICPASTELGDLKCEFLQETDSISYKVCHYCSICHNVDPLNPDIFTCETPHCSGFRYRGGLSA